MSLGEPEVSPEKVQARAADLNGEPVHKGGYKAQKKGDSIYGCLPPDFVNHYGIEQSTELDTYVDFELGCLIVFPKGATTDE